MAFENQVGSLQTVFFERRTGCLHGLSADFFDQLKELGEAQHDQRHRVIAVEIWVEDQVGLVADADDQCACGLDRLRPTCFIRVFEPLRERRGEFAAVHALAEACLGVAQHIPGDRLRREERLAHDGNVLVADDFLAREIDGDELLVDQDSRDEDYRREVKRVDQDQLATHAQAPDQAHQYRKHTALLVLFVMRLKQQPCLDPE